MTRTPEPKPEQQLEPVTHATIAAALAAFQADMPVVAKESTAKIDTRSGNGYSYSYANLADITRAIFPLLARHGLAWTTRPQLIGDRWQLVGMLLHAHSDGVLEGMLPLTGGGPQDWGSSITYMRRYLLGAVTGVVTDEDDDGAAAQQSHARQQSAQQRASRAPEQRREQSQRRAQPTAQASAQPPANVPPTAEWQQGVVDIVNGFEPGPDRDELLRALHERARAAGVLEQLVELPQLWRGPNDPDEVTLAQLIVGSRPVPMPPRVVEQQQPLDTTSDDDPWQSDAPGANVERI